MSLQTKFITITSGNFLEILIGIIVTALTLGFFTVINLWVRRKNVFIQTYPLRFVLRAKFIILSIPVDLPFMSPTLIGFAIYRVVSVKYLQTYVNGVILSILFLFFLGYDMIYIAITYWLSPRRILVWYYFKNDKVKRRQALGD